MRTWTTLRGLFERSWLQSPEASSVSEQQITWGHPQKSGQENQLPSMAVLGGATERSQCCAASLVDSSYFQPGKSRVCPGTEQEAGVSGGLAPPTTAGFTLPLVKDVETDTGPRSRY